MGIGFRELLIILLIALVLFGAKKLKSVGSDLGSAVRGFKKAMSDGEDEQNKQLSDLTGTNDAGLCRETLHGEAGHQAERLSRSCSRSVSRRSC
jgi:sec-independent protein translocase protein TatA